MSQGLTGPGRGRAVAVTAGRVLCGPLEPSDQKNLQHLEINCFTCLSCSLHTTFPVFPSLADTRILGPRELF